MPVAITIGTENAGFGPDWFGDPSSGSVGVFGGSNPDSFGGADSLRITFSDSGDRILQIETLDSSGAVLATYRHEDNLTGTLDNTDAGAPLDTTQQTDEVGAYTGLDSFVNVSDPSDSFDTGSTGDNLWVAPETDISTGVFSFETGKDENGDGDVDTFDPTNVPCFAAGTLIETDKGLKPVEDIVAGDMVRTRDRGFQTVRFAAHRTIDAKGSFAPVVIAKGALGNDRDLKVSPNHRMLVSGARIEALFGASEMLVAAGDLIDGDQIYSLSGGKVTYVHIAFDNHEIIFAEGAETESLQPFAADALAFGGKAYEELVAIFPELDAGTQAQATVRPVLKSAEAALLH